MLTELQCKNFPPQDKSYKKFDGGGMFLLVKPNGNKYWHLKYKYAGKEKLVSLGVYPGVSLKEARKKRDELKVKISENIDPVQEKKQAKNELKENVANIFENIALEWHRHKWDDLKQFVIPVYQRNYDWKTENCKQLYDDIVKITKEHRKSHFFGSLVFVYNPDGHNEEFLIIDGRPESSAFSKNTSSINGNRRTPESSSSR